MVDTSNNNEMLQTLNFFDTVFNSIPQSFRQIDKQDLVDSKKSNKKEKAISLLELHQGVQTKIKDMQRVNREKSLKKIAELTEKHQ